MASGLVALTATALTISPAAAAAGPSSSQSNYLVPTAAGVDFTSMLTTGDTVPKVGGGNYVMAGIPDGLGAFDNGDGTFTVLMNHELGNTVGATRAHGNIGAFVSRLVINKSTLQVVSGEDQMKTVVLTSGGSTAFSRFCSADLAPVSAFFNAGSGKGTQNRIFMNGEESGAEGRAMGHVVSGQTNGTSYELPSLGNMSFENSVANPATADRTVVAVTDDSTPGQVYVYVGDKQTTGTDVEKAGLFGGNLFGIKVTGVPTEARTTSYASPLPFTLAPLGDVSTKTGAQIETDSNAAGITTFLRPEDVSWDASNPKVMYFNTTDRLDQVADGTGAQVGRSRMWRVTFADLANLAAGGTIEAVLDGGEGQNMLDNLTVDQTGAVITIEDTGNAPHNAKVWRYNPGGDTLTMLGKHDPARFGDIGVAPTPPYTVDEESSGVIDVAAILGPGKFLIDVQDHRTIADPNQVEGGQLLVMSLPSPAPEVPEVPLTLLLPVSAAALLGAAWVVGRRRQAATA